jgi:hypothetical protein
MFSQSDIEGRLNAYLPATQVSLGQMKRYLDSQYPGKYSVQVFEKAICLGDSTHETNEA